MANRRLLSKDITANRRLLRITILLKAVTSSLRRNQAINSHRRNQAISSLHMANPLPNKEDTTASNLHLLLRANTLPHRATNSPATNRTARYLLSSKVTSSRAITHPRRRPSAMAHRNTFSTTPMAMQTPCAPP